MPPPIAWMELEGSRVVCPSVGLICELHIVTPSVCAYFVHVCVRTEAFSDQLAVDVLFS